MDITGALRNLSASFQDYCHKTQQASCSVVLELKELRNNPDFLQKVCQVAFASLQLLFVCYPASVGSLSRFSFALTTANMTDFYRLIQYPRHWFSPITVEGIDEHKALEDITNFLYEELKCSTEDERENLRKAVQKCLTEQLMQMTKYNDAYRNIEEFVSIIEKRLREENGENYAFAKDYFANVDLSNLNKANPNYQVANWVRKTSLIQRIMDINWTLVDIGCVGLYFQGWKLWDTAKWADRIGQYSAFQWVKNQRLDIWVVGLVFSGFAIKLFESVRKLRDETLTPQAKRQARWDVATSLAEAVFFGAIYTNLIGRTLFNNVYLQCLAIVAKSLGLLSIATKPKPKFFQQPVS